MTGEGHHDVQGRGRRHAASAESLRLPRTDYLKLCLLHRPRPGNDLPATLRCVNPPFTPIWDLAR